MTPLLRLRHASLILTLVLGSAAWAQSAAPEFIHHGHFRQLMHSGDTRGRIALDTLPQQPGWWGVGATAGLRGEIVQLDGQLLVSPGSDPDGAVRSPLPGEQALLFAAARVSGWSETVLPQDMNQAQFEDFVRQQARQAGLAEPFVYRVQGRFPRLRWHVVTGEAPSAGGASAPPTGHGGHAAHGGHANSRSDLRVFHQPGASGQLIGVCADAALEGVITHPGERHHLHFVDRAGRSAGHVDAYSVAAGSVLLLPRR